MTDHRKLAEQILAGPSYRHPESPEAAADMAAAGAHATLALLEAIESLMSTVDVSPAATFEDAGRQILARGIGSPEGEPYHFTVYEEIRQERQAQYAQGWSFEHDRKHGMAHLYEQINSWLLKPGDHPHYSERERLIVVAALAVAAVDQIDGKPSV